MQAKPYRIIFMGTPEFAVPTLEALLAHGEEVVAVVCQPDRPKGRGRQLAIPPVKAAALQAGLPVLQPSKVRTPEFLAELGSFQPDLLAVAAYGRILTGAVLALPPLGCLNVHGSLLPKYRGAAPIQWAILNGEAEAGITIMQMDEGMDTGDMLLSGAIPLDPEETTATLVPKMAQLGGQLLCQALDLLRAGQLVAKKQDDALATLAPLLKKEDGLIDWRRPAAAIGCQIRGLDPWPGANTSHAGGWLRLFRPQVIAQPAQEAPGTLCRADAEGLLVATGDGYLLLRELQREGGKRLPVADFLRGHRLAAGLRFDLPSPPRA